MTVKIALRRTNEVKKVEMNDLALLVTKLTWVNA